MKTVAKLLTVSTIAIALGCAHALVTAAPAEARSGSKSSASKPSSGGSMSRTGATRSAPKATTKGTSKRGGTKGLSGTDLGSGR